MLLCIGGDGGSRTLVQRYRHLSFYECSRYIPISLDPSAYRLASGAASLIVLFLPPSDGEIRRSPLKLSPLPYHMGDGGRNR